MEKKVNFIFFICALVLGFEICNSFLPNNPLEQINNSIATLQASNDKMAESITTLQISVDTIDQAIQESQKPTPPPTPPSATTTPTPANLFACATELKAMERARDQMLEEKTEPLSENITDKAKIAILNTIISTYLFCLYTSTL